MNGDGAVDSFDVQAFNELFGTTERATADFISTKDPSPTDAHVNKLGRKLGSKWHQAISGSNVSKWLYEKLCDESCCEVKNKGPLDDTILE